MKWTKQHSKNAVRAKERKRMTPLTDEQIAENWPGRSPCQDAGPAVPKAWRGCQGDRAVPTQPTPRPIAALFVARRSIYRHLPGVETYDRTRDARQFAGGKPVIAHPPCRLWSKLAHQVTLPTALRNAEMDLGRWAVDVVMKNGGVLEQPAGSRLWEACQLPRCGDRSDPFCWTLYLEQSWFGFATPKPTWLLICGVPQHLVKVPSYQLMTKSRVSFSRLNAFDRSRTMRPLAEWLCQVARASWWMPT